MNKHKYLDNYQSTRNVSLLLALLAGVAALATYFLKDSSLLAMITLVLAVLSAMAMTVLLMHYIRHNWGKKKSRNVSRALHAYLLNAGWLLAFLLVGKSGTFSYAVVHAVLDGLLVALLILVAGCFYKKGISVWVAVFAAAAVALLSLYGQLVILNIVILAIAAVAAIMAFMKVSSSKGFAYGAAMLAIIAVVMGVLSLLGIDSEHQIMHLAILAGGLLLAIGAPALITKADTDIVSAGEADRSSKIISDTTDDKVVYDKKKWIDKDYQGLSYQQLLDAPVEALHGVSNSDAVLLNKAFGIKTIGDLADNKFFSWADEITAEAEGTVFMATTSADNSPNKASSVKTTDEFDLHKWVDKNYHHLSLDELLKAPADALYGVSKSDAELLRNAFGIKTVSDFATNKFFLWADEIVAEASKE